jgi:hypothetical protein
VFSLRFLTDTGLPGDPVAHDGQPFTCQHAVTARERAKTDAVLFGRPIAVMRGDRVAYTLSPEGSRASPAGALVPERARCTAERGACFCLACRAARRRT